MHVWCVWVEVLKSCEIKAHSENALSSVWQNTIMILMSEVQRPSAYSKTPPLMVAGCVKPVTPVIPVVAVGCEKEL